MSCIYYECKSSIFGCYYYCIKNEKEIPDDIYKQYCKGYNYDNCPIYKHQESSGCFITTVVCDILGKKDNDETLEILRNFRDNVLQKCKDYEGILKEYDNIGPEIADAILHDEDKTTIANFLFNDVIKPISRQIESKNYSRAIQNYELMTLSLINYYGLKHGYNKAIDNDYNYNNGEFDQKTAGHGRRKIKVQKVNN